MSDLPIASANTFDSAKAFLALWYQFQPELCCSTHTSLVPLSSTTRPTASACHLSILSAISTVNTPSDGQGFSSSPLLTKSPRMLSTRCKPGLPFIGVKVPERFSGVEVPFSIAIWGGRPDFEATVGDMGF